MCGILFGYFGLIFVDLSLLTTVWPNESP